MFMTTPQPTARRLLLNPMGTVVVLFASLLFVGATAVAAEASMPNVVIILADDMGYGDPGCFNPGSKITTPHIDRLAREGILCTLLDRREVGREASWAGAGLIPANTERRETNPILVPSDPDFEFAKRTQFHRKWL